MSFEFLGCKSGTVIMWENIYCLGDIYLKIFGDEVFMVCVVFQ